jgi:hypothetical protein
MGCVPPEASLDADDAGLAESSLPPASFCRGGGDETGADRLDGSAYVQLSIRVRDQGEGFDPEAVAKPLAAENLLKSSGRGIFLIRKLMDDVQLHRAPEGGMEIRMIKRVASI